MVVFVPDDDTVANCCYGLQTGYQLLYLVDVCLVRQYGLSGGGYIGICNPFHLVISDGICAFVAEAEEYLALFLPYPLHLTAEHVLVVDAVQLQQSPAVVSYFSDIVVAAGPDHAFRVAKDRGQSGDARCVDNAPLCVVIVEQAFKVGHVHRSVSTRDDVEVLVMCLVLGGSEIANEGYALGVC